MSSTNKKFMYRTIRYTVFFFKQITIKTIKFIEYWILAYLINLAEINLFIIYTSFTYSNPNNLAFKIEKSIYPHESASTTIFSLPYMYFIIYENIFMNLTHLACLQSNFFWPFRCFNDSWYEWIMNYFGHK
jgi:hypothetical protein